MTAFRAAPQSFRDQRGLSYPRLTCDVDDAAPRIVKLVQCQVERGQLGIAPDEPRSRFTRADGRRLGPDPFL
jgi:hypothetical protein